MSEPYQCPYLKERESRQEYFCGIDADEEQFQTLLDHRWRRFGLVFFRPVCPECRQCIPLRVDVRLFSSTGSQKRVLRKNRRTEVRFCDLDSRPELYDLYEKHSRIKFEQEVSEKEFLKNFYQPAAPSFQSEYYIDGQLAGFGILDQSSNGLSSVYFSYDPDFAAWSLGTFSILAEIEETRRRGLSYYYTGYYVPDCSRMAYKGRFHPYEVLVDGCWVPEAAVSEKSV